ncbi:hypothetical protein HPB50_019043 [Hyalomma asiaticum]|uniref:Uncharacterized protein n=1 Tax=Hyalomma asiaticum TaxID=266040 RepID=A0ACB7TK67_HYAAI|nr:hypothetical protein HPB50_019043 [Hyalomma asiaticum]
MPYSAGSASFLLLFRASHLFVRADPSVVPCLHAFERCWVHKLANCVGAMDCVVPSEATFRTVVELMDFDGGDEEFDDVVTLLALKLTRIQRNRIPMYLEEVLAYAAPVFIHDRRQCRQDAAD